MSYVSLANLMANQKQLSSWSLGSPQPASYTGTNVNGILLSGAQHIGDSIGSTSTSDTTRPTGVQLSSGVYNRHSPAWCGNEASRSTDCGEEPRHRRSEGPEGGCTYSSSSTARNCRRWRGASSDPAPGSTGPPTVPTKPACATGSALSHWTAPRPGSESGLSKICYRSTMR